MKHALFPRSGVTAIKLSDASGVKRLQPFLQTTIEWFDFIPATAKAVALQLNLMAVTPERGNDKHLGFSIIIPTLNEEKTIEPYLLALQPLRSRCEIIIVDAGNTVSSHAHLADKIISSAKGRARQMNIGASHATGDVLIFLHADTYLPEQALQLIEQHFGHQQWGRFDIRLSGDHFMLKVIAWMMNRRSRLTGIATGDQVIFVTRQAFTAAGGYPEIALMEDIALSKALKKIGPPVCLDAKVTSSGRRWERYGIYTTILLMWSLRLRYFFGADPQLLAQLYNGRSGFSRD